MAIDFRSVQPDPHVHTPNTTSSRAAPLLPVVPWIAGGFVVLAAATLAVGFLVTEVLRSSVGRLDEEIGEWVVGRRSGVLDAILGPSSELGNTTTIVAAAVAFAAAALAARRWQPVFVIAVALAMELAVFLTANYWLDRPRPDLDALGSVPSTASYPSGHAAASVVLYFGIALATVPSIQWRSVRRAAWVVSAVIALSVGVARLYRGLHHPTDVLAGWLVGAGCLHIASRAAIALRQQRRGRDETSCDCVVDRGAPASSVR